jgi:hypothetical protein
MKRAIENQAPIAALVYGLALIDTLAGFYYGTEAKRQAKRGDGVGIRYGEFVKKYLSPAESGCNYKELDLYKSLRCNMAHSLTPGHHQKGEYLFELRQDSADSHGTKKLPGTVIFDVPTFCTDVLHAGEQFLKDVEQSLAQGSDPLILSNFKAWWDKGYSILVSDS